MKFENNRLSTINVGDTLFTTEVTPLLNEERGVRFNDAVYVELPSGEVWFFDYGIVVFWGVEEDERKALLNRLRLDAIDVEHSIQDHYRFEINAPLAKIQHDTVFLADDDKLSRLAISHAMAQSSKLAEYENKAQQTIIDHADIPETLATTGKIALGRTDIAKIRGRLFSTKSDIILHYGLLDTPDFFWQYPEHEAGYNGFARYLEIRQRVDLLSKKLETIHELFQMLADEQKHQHSSFLEWIIIILIAFEIVIFCAQEISKYI